MSESSEPQQKKASKTKAFKKGLSKLVKSPKKSHPAVLTFDDGSVNSSGNRSATLAYDHRARQQYNQGGILKRSRSLNQLETKEDDDTESLNSAATISVFRSVHFDSTKHLEEGKIADSGWASSSKGDTTNDSSAPGIKFSDSHYLHPRSHVTESTSGTTRTADYHHGSGTGSNRISASVDNLHVQGRSATLPRNAKLRSLSDGGDGAGETIDGSEDHLPIHMSQTIRRPKDLDNLGVIKLVQSNQNLTTVPTVPASQPVTTTIPIQSPQHDLSRVPGITPVQLKELEERIERKVRRTVDKILRKQKDTGTPSLSGSNQKLTVWECMVLEIQRAMETLYIEKVKKERHLIQKEIIKKLEAEKRPTQESGIQANLTVVEARPFIKPQEVKHTDFESQTDAIPEPEVKLSILKTQTDDVQQYNVSSQTREIEEIEIIESLNARLHSLQTDYDTLRRQYNDKLKEVEMIRIELSTHNRPTSNLETVTEETITDTAGTQTNELVEMEIIRELQLKLGHLERERQKVESLYEEKVTEINTLTLEYQQNVMNLEGQIKRIPKTTNVKIQANPEVYDTGIQSQVRTSDLWTYTDAGRQYPDSSDLQIQVNTVTRDEGSSTVPIARFNVGLQCTPATKDASDSTNLSLNDLEEIEVYARLYLEREETEIVTKRVRSETPELPDNSLILKYLETSGNRSDDMISAVGVLLKSDEAHTVSLESMRFMDVETTTDQTAEDSTTGYYSKVTERNGFGSSGGGINGHSISSHKFNTSKQGEANLGVNGNAFHDRDLNGSSRGYYHSTTTSYFSDADKRTSKLTSTPQSDHDYSFELSTSSMGRPSFESNVSVNNDRPMRRFLKYGLSGQQQDPVVDHRRTNNYVPEP